MNARSLPRPRASSRRPTAQPPPPVPDSNGAQQLLPLAMFTLLICAVSGAGAATPQRVASVKDFSSGPFVIDAGLAWLEQTSTRYAVRSAAPGRRPRRLASGRNDPERPYSDEVVTVALSSKRVALMRHMSSTFRTAFYENEFLTGPLGGGLRRHFGCSAQGPGARPAVEGDVVASFTASFDQSSRNSFCTSAVEVRDFARGSARRFEPPAPNWILSGVALGGRWLAAGWYDYSGRHQSVRVFDRLTGALALSIAVEPSSPFDIASDGTLFVQQDSDPRGRCTSRLVAYPSGSATAHPLAPATCPGVLSAGETSVLAAVVDRGRRTLMRFGRSGDRRPLVDLGPAGLLAGDVDFVGDRAGYALRECDGEAAVFVVQVSVAVPRPERLSCPAKLRSRRATVRRGRLGLRVVCPRGCVGRIGLWRDKRRLGGSRRLASAAGSRPRPVAVRLTRTGQRLLRRRGRVRVVAELRTLDRAGRRLRPTKRRVLLLPR